MAQSPLIIFSPDADFSTTLAACVQSELDLSCVIVSTKNDLKQNISDALAVVATENIEEKLPCEVISVMNPPVKMQDLLDDIANLLHNPTIEDVRFGEDFCLQLRQKQLSHTPSGKSVLLTDKEVQLLQQMARNVSKMVPKDLLLKEVWGFDDTIDTHTLETHIYRLRGKFRDISGDDSAIIATDGGYGLNIK